MNKALSNPSIEQMNNVSDAMVDICNDFHKYDLFKTHSTGDSDFCIGCSEIYFAMTKFATKLGT